MFNRFFSFVSDSLTCFSAPDCAAFGGFMCRVDEEGATAFFFVFVFYCVVVVFT